MPTDEDGFKWACEACVRGHRATRCDHFDRWMVRVKRPGRPLRECPHATAPCSCHDDKVIMMRIPKREQKGKCNCRKLRSFDPAIDDDNSQPSRRPPRQRDPSDPTRMLPYPSLQPVQQGSGQSNALYPPFREHLMTVGASARTPNDQDARAESSHGLAMQHAIQSQQPASDLSPNDPATPTQSGQGSHQMQSPLLGQSHSLATMQGHGIPQQVTPDSSVYPNFALQPVQPDALHFQSQFSPLPSYQPVLNGNNGQEGPSISTATLTPPPDPDIQYGVNPAQSMTGHQLEQLQPMGYHYPETHGAYPMYNPAVWPSAEYDALRDCQNCSCGTGCNCAYCRVHPLNQATRARVQDLSELLARDNYLDGNPQASQPQSGTEGDLTNGNNMESEIGLGYLPPVDDTFSSSSLEWMDAPTGSPVLGPTSVLVVSPVLEPILDEESVDNDDQSIEVPTDRMRDCDYFTMAYPVRGDCTDATGSCLCGHECSCVGCLTHQGHTEDQE